jgi:hypothetical protein
MVSTAREPAQRPKQHDGQPSISIAMCFVFNGRDARLVQKQVRVQKVKKERRKEKGEKEGGQQHNQQE